MVCQFGAMFFPDKPHAYAEVRRVLRPGGHFLFNVWDRIETNEFPKVVEEALAGLFPGNPSWFISRVPHGYHDTDRLRGEIEAREPGGLDRATEAALQALQARFGTGPVASTIQAHVVTVRK